MSAIVAYAFSGDVSHAVILAGVIMGTAFLFIEARRFQDYDIWRSRVRVLQENLFANALDPSAGVEQRAWREALSGDYRNPTTNIGYRGAFSHRLRRVYPPLITAMLIGWLFHLWAFSPDEPFPRSAALPGIDGRLVAAAVGVYYLALLVLAVPLSDKERGESGAADRSDIEREE